MVMRPGNGFGSFISVSLTDVQGHKIGQFWPLKLAKVLVFRLVLKDLAETDEDFGVFVLREEKEKKLFILYARYVIASRFLSNTALQENPGKARFMIRSFASSRITMSNVCWK